MSVILALDQGTTSSRAIVFDHSGSILGVAQQEFPQYYPRGGWVEHDPEEIWRGQLQVAREVMQQCGLAASDVAALGITNQRETTLLWDRGTGEPVYPAIVWQDRRTASLCEALRSNGVVDLVRDKTGLVIDPYFCASKLRWLLDEVPGARQRAERGELAFGTVDSWLFWKLTGGSVHAIDATNASRTMLFGLESGQWDEELLQLWKIPRQVLPEVVPSSHVVGETLEKWFGGAIPIGGAAGDQHAALFGQNCTRAPMAKNTYGTGCFTLMNVGDQRLRSHSHLLTTSACHLGGDRAPRSYALEGSIFVAGAIVQWLRDGLGIIGSSSEVEPLAASVPDSGGVVLVPALAGLGAPHWDPYARGTLIGLTRGTTAAHIARAALEGIAMQVADVLDAMKRDVGQPIEELRVDGGGSANELMMQFQADILGVPVVRPRITETTAAGAAFLAGLAVGFWQDTDQIAEVWQAEKVFQPEMPDAEVARRRARWHEALQRSRGWETPG